ncbi:IS66-like element accessory protein TnpA [Paraburkholderia humisilvae]|uniref:IS66-like element accessory protein TnpA n=1 Tax=Paraburkholderia humisilvae TaxID=627669 RepID=UPI001583B3A2|nr:transposase [Paraburkholderia humisilvae]
MAPEEEQISRGTRKGRPNHSPEFRRRLAAAACEPGVSVSQLAREHGINANMLFKWRRQYRAQQQSGTTSLLPVEVVNEAGPVADAGAAVAHPCVQESGGTLEIRIGRAVVNVSGMVDADMLRTVLESLR